MPCVVGEAVKLNDEPVRSPIAHRPCPRPFNAPIGLSLQRGETTIFIHDSLCGSPRVLKLETVWDAGPQTSDFLLQTFDLATSFIASRAALIVVSTSLTVCAADRNHASNCEGGG